MIKFHQIEDDDPALTHSPMVRAIEKTFGYITEYGGIGLTPSKAFKRVFVHWAVREFDWPGYTETELFAVNRVLNEIDFGPLTELHDVMIALRIGRHYKGQFKLTKAGQELVGHPGRIFGIVTPFYLFEVNHARFSRFHEEAILGNWDLFLNVLDVEAENGITGADLRQVLFGEPKPDDHFDNVMSSLYIQVLRPLCWAGLLQENQKTNGSLRMRDCEFSKTPLWKAALRLSGSLWY